MYMQVLDAIQQVAQSGKGGTIMLTGGHHTVTPKLMESVASSSRTYGMTHIVVDDDRLHEFKASGWRDCCPSPSLFGNSNVHTTQSLSPSAQDYGTWRLILVTLFQQSLFQSMTPRPAKQASIQQIMKLSPLCWVVRRENPDSWDANWRDVVEHLLDGAWRNPPSWKLDDAKTTACVNTVAEKRHAMLPLQSADVTVCPTRSLCQNVFGL